MKNYLKLLLKFSRYIVLLLLALGIGLFYIHSIENTGVKRTGTPVKEQAGKPIEEKEGNENEKNLFEYLSDELSSSRGAKAQKAREKDAFKITILDVDQASCALIESNGEYMLFDGGDRDTSSYVVAFLRERGINHIKYLVASHFHADHVYGLVGAIESGIKYDYLICPDYETDVYAKEALLGRVTESSKMVEPYVSQKFEIGDITARTISPVTSDYSDDNGYSVGMIFQYGNVSVLIDGDATAETEADMLENGIDVKADILVVPHHGSTYSSSLEWLEQVGATVAICSCGNANEYGHPHASTLERLQSAGITELYRTDLQGNIEITCSENDKYVIKTEHSCDADKLWVAGQKVVDDKSISDLWDSNNETKEAYYIGNTASRKFHRPSCEQLPSEQKSILFSTREEALRETYTPCGMCQP